MTGVIAIEPGVGGSLAELFEVLGRTADAMVAIDGEFRIISWNEAATELLGYPGFGSAGETVPRDSRLERDRCGDGVCDGFCPAASPGDGKRAEERGAFADGVVVERSPIRLGSEHACEGVCDLENELVLLAEQRRRLSWLGVRHGPPT